MGRAFAAAIQGADAQTKLWGAPLATVAQRLKNPNITTASLTAVNGSTVSDVLLGGLFAAGRSCTQPNALTANQQAAVVQK